MLEALQVCFPLQDLQQQLLSFFCHKCHRFSICSNLQDLWEWHYQELPDECNNEQLMCVLRSSQANTVPSPEVGAISS